MSLYVVIINNLLREISFEVCPYTCKGELLVRLPNRMTGYAKWLPDSWRIVVVVDRDDADCNRLKQRLESMAAAGHVTRSASGGGRYDVVNRLAIEELEAWYFGDWEAVRAAYPRALATIPLMASYRDSDAISGGTWEAFERVLQRAGYCATGLRKIEAAREVAARMIPERNRSRSFQAFRANVADMVTH